MKHESVPSSPPDISAGYERSDMPVRPIVQFMIGFSIFLLIAHLLMVIMFHLLGEKVQAPITPQSPQVVQVHAPVIGPQLEVTSSSNWQEMKEAQERLLYGESTWVNPQAGVVRIPIGRAMELALQRGFPVRAAATQSSQSEK